MVLPAKIFEIREEITLEQAAGRLRDFLEVEPYETPGGGRLNMITQVLDLMEGEDLVSGVFSKDIPRERVYRRRVIFTPTTEEAPFWVVPHEDRFFLIIMAPSVARGVKKLLTNHVANKLSEVLFGVVGAVVEARIPHETLRTLHESNPQATRLIWFDNVDIPGVEKLCLAGEGVVDTRQYREYMEHSLIWYVVFESRRRGVTVGITRGSVVTLFSKSSVEDFITYIREDLLPLISRRD